MYTIATQNTQTPDLQQPLDSLSSRPGSRHRSPPVGDDALRVDAQSSRQRFKLAGRRGDRRRQQPSIQTPSNSPRSRPTLRCRPGRATLSRISGSALNCGSSTPPICGGFRTLSQCWKTTRSVRTACAGWTPARLRCS